MATISAPTASGAVKIRNLSTNGALIEGTALPAVKEQVRIRRGHLSVMGEVVWCGAGQAGLRFYSGVSVKDWLPPASSRTAQQRVDEMLQEARTEPRSTISRTDPRPSALHSAQLMRLAQELEAFGSELAGDPVVFARHTSKLQTIDIAAQALRNLSAERFEAARAQSELQPNEQQD